MASDNEFEFPTLSQRVIVTGRTGSGKTQFGFWLLSNAEFDRQPFVILDYKRDALINSSEHLRELSLNEKLPTHPGLYIVHPRAGPSDTEAVEAWLWRVLEHEDIGLFTDETYMVPDIDAFPAILTQGRSKHIPAIMLTQRPAWLSRFVFSEADYFAVFHLNDVDDRKKVRRYLPRAYDVDARADKFCCSWYDVGRDVLFSLRPVPDRDSILEAIDAKLGPRRKVI